MDIVFLIIGAIVGLLLVFSLENTEPIGQMIYPIRLL